MASNWFAIPFMAGFLFLAGTLLYLYIRWLLRLTTHERTKIRRALFTGKSLSAAKEVFMESLLHRKIFRVNPVLGYMHMSLAFGWFLLIVAGKIETHVYTGRWMNPLYFPVFFRYLEPNPHPYLFQNTFTFVMDFLLLVILSGLSIAIAKRFRSRITGLKSTTRHTTGDRLALSTLWFIFPLRLLAESASAAATGHGGFLTLSTGYGLSALLPIAQLVNPLWWAYSISLGLFFVAIPFSRYMHIPTEVLLIFLRHYGLKSHSLESTFAAFEIQSCSRCGICIDTCQLNSQAANRTSQSVYLVRNIRERIPDIRLSNDCLLCGRCTEICPVGIDLSNLRILARKQSVIDRSIEPPSYHEPQHTSQTDVIYFAGCMTHLTPSIYLSMIKILKTADIRYTFMDEDGSVCCGRPLRLAGKNLAAQSLMEYNRQIILQSGAHTLVTSCPICFRTFRDDYQLNIRVMHHSEYLLELIRNRKLKLNRNQQHVVYHDPCELGRGSGIYEPPRQVIRHISRLISLPEEREKALCCGGSLGNLSGSPQQRQQLQRKTAALLNESQPQSIVTACPLCKKSLAPWSNVPVKDIAELVASTIDCHHSKVTFPSKEASFGIVS